MGIVEHAQVLGLGRTGDADLARLDMEIGLSQAAALNEDLDCGRALVQLRQAAEGRAFGGGRHVRCGVFSGLMSGLRPSGRERSEAMVTAEWWARWWLSSWMDAPLVGLVVCPTSTGERQRGWSARGSGGAIAGEECDADGAEGGDARREIARVAVATEGAGDEL